MQEMKCKFCANFDRRGARGNLISIDGTKGLCRGRNGLLLGERDEESICPPNQQPYFIPIYDITVATVPE